MTDKAPGLSRKSVQDLLETHELSDARTPGLDALVQDAYRLGWEDRDKSRSGSQLQELPITGAELSAALDRLGQRERRTVELRFGLVSDGGSQGRTLDQIAKDLDVSRERVRQILDRAIPKMLSEDQD